MWAGCLLGFCIWRLGARWSHSVAGFPALPRPSCRIPGVPSLERRCVPEALPVPNPAPFLCGPPRALRQRERGCLTVKLGESGGTRAFLSPDSHGRAFSTPGVLGGPRPGGPCGQPHEEPSPLVSGSGMWGCGSFLSASVFGLHALPGFLRVPSRVWGSHAFAGIFSEPLIV